jgi:hypothetical protein
LPLPSDQRQEDKGVGRIDITIDSLKIAKHKFSNTRLQNPKPRWFLSRCHSLAVHPLAPINRVKNAHMYPQVSLESRMITAPRGSCGPRKLG